MNLTRFFSTNEILFSAGNYYLLESRKSLKQKIEAAFTFLLLYCILAKKIKSEVRIMHYEDHDRSLVDTCANSWNLLKKVQVAIIMNALIFNVFKVCLLVHWYNFSFMIQFGFVTLVSMICSSYHARVKLLKSSVRTTRDELSLTFDSLVCNLLTKCNFTCFATRELGEHKFRDWKMNVSMDPQVRGTF